ncbi:carbon monoxide dehydrogenase [Haematobacter missouriensis]|uniref:Carbon monoxide dehydrogenase n=1 Tax=Haematobacter missouriensis TaxID=366616 RepID=A0A212AL96_9RHOB|nr:(2Fe-2S)-binding protein [Haematobacter missouriensis]KFI32484.1 carbon monoxide dehydrogenase [Haematobacter missouriensis]OWJ76445.1 carbon monoxide dehydrogenase [Haematobacter missouriensis]OWJ82284.1 carbon monoxide dehydrogenase [Haematobacter missouriensis]
MIEVTMKVNGREITRTVPGRRLLVEFLREDLRLTGTHVGCDTSQCGACTVHLNGRSVKSCTVLAAACDGAEVTTIEGITPTEGLHPMQQAFADTHGLQCGYCTPGMIMTALSLVRPGGGMPDREELRELLHGNLCRCTGYQNILAAIEKGAEMMHRGECDA